MHIKPSDHAPYTQMLAVDPHIHLQIFYLSVILPFQQMGFLSMDVFWNCTKGKLFRAKIVQFGLKWNSLLSCISLPGTLPIENVPGSNPVQFRWVSISFLMMVIHFISNPVRMYKVPSICCSIRSTGNLLIKSSQVSVWIRISSKLKGQEFNLNWILCTSKHYSAVNIAQVLTSMKAQNLLRIEQKCRLLQIKIEFVLCFNQRGGTKYMCTYASSSFSLKHNEPHASKKKLLLPIKPTSIVV